MKVKESKKVGLKLSIQKTKIIMTSPITSWQIDGETVETVADFNFFYFCCAMSLVGSQFLDQGLNPGHSRESLEA